MGCGNAGIRMEVWSWDHGHLRDLGRNRADEADGTDVGRLHERLGADHTRTLTDGVNCG